MCTDTGTDGGHQSCCNGPVGVSRHVCAQMNTTTLVSGSCGVSFVRIQSFSLALEPPKSALCISPCVRLSHEVTLLYEPASEVSPAKGS